VLIDLHGLSARECPPPGFSRLNPPRLPVRTPARLHRAPPPCHGFIMCYRRYGSTLTDDLAPYLSERMIRLGGCFLPGDRKRQIGKMAPTRGRPLGRPEDAFAFATFR
jgi:hypothetical protein